MQKVNLSSQTSLLPDSQQSNIYQDPLLHSFDKNYFSTASCPVKKLNRRMVRSIRLVAIPGPPFDTVSNSMRRKGPDLTRFLLDLIPLNTSTIPFLYVRFPLYTSNLSKWLMQLQVSACKESRRYAVGYVFWWLVIIVARWKLYQVQCAPLYFSPYSIPYGTQGQWNKIIKMEFGS